VENEENDKRLDETIEKLDKLSENIDDRRKDFHEKIERAKENLRKANERLAELSVSFTLKQKEKVDIVIDLLKEANKKLEKLSKEHEKILKKLIKIRKIQDEDLYHICESLDKPFWEKLKTGVEVGSLMVFIKNVMSKSLSQFGL